MDTGTKQTPVHSTVTAQRIPVGGTGREQKEHVVEGGEKAIEQLRHTAEQAYDKACDMCHNWRHYPRLLTTVVLLSSFLLGSLTTGTVQRMGFLGGSRNYVSSHWDRETSDAHHALDVVLDHLKHPTMYQSEKGTSYVNRARSGLMNLFGGLMPGRSRSSMGYDSGDMMDKGREMYDQATGRTWYDKATGRGLSDKAADMASDLSYGARRGMEQAKDVGYGIGHKLGDTVDSVKSMFGGDRSRDSDYGRGDGGDGWFGGSKETQPSRGSSWFGGGGKETQPSRGSSWFGGSDEKYVPTGRDEYDDFGLAADKIKKVVRTAEREM